MSDEGACVSAARAKRAAPRSALVDSPARYDSRCALSSGTFNMGDGRSRYAACLVGRDPADLLTGRQVTRS